MQADATFQIRWMIRADLPEVLAIERDSFADGWDEDAYVRAMASGGFICLVAERGDNVCARMVYTIRDQVLELLSVAVSAEHRRGGIGIRMVRRLTALVLSGDRARLVLFVRERNVDAQLFFRACGLRATGTIRAGYKSPQEDAIRMEYRRLWAPQWFEVIRSTKQRGAHP